MEIPDLNSLQQDTDGTYRSEPLPRVRGKNIDLPERLSGPNGIHQWEMSINDPQNLVVLDLFSGAGGMSLGFQDAGFFIGAGIDLNEAASRTHGYNFLSKSLNVDIRSIDDPEEYVREELGIPRVDVIIGGPPCQGFSRVGRGKLRSIELTRYYDEVINSLYKEFIRFVDALEPLAFVMENVPDMATFNDGDLMRRIKERFETADSGYVVDYKILDAVYYGVPQRRRRLFVQGNRIGGPIRWPASIIDNRKIVTVRDAIEDLPVRTPPSRKEELPYVATDLTPYQRQMRSRLPDREKSVVFDHIIRDVRDDDKIIFHLLDEGQKYSDVPDELRRYRSDIFKDKYWKLIWDEPSWTITAHIRKDSYRYIHPDREQCRMLSIREFARLQSFPDQFRFCGTPTRRMQQIGNAVPPLLAEKIASELYQQIKAYQAQASRVERAEQNEAKVFSEGK